MNRYSAKQIHRFLPGIFLLLQAIIIPIVAVGQTSHRVNAQSVEPAKYWIFLKDKSDGFGKTTRVEKNYVSARAAERRVRRGHVQDPMIDAPLSPLYLETLRGHGIEGLRQSRWLNAVTARLDRRQVELVRNLSFVREIRVVARAVRAVTSESKPNSAGLVPAGPAPAPAISAIMAAPASPAFLAPLVPLARGATRFDYGKSRVQLDLVNAIPAIERGIDGTGVRLGFLDTNFDGFRHAVFDRMRNDGRVLADSNFTGFDPQTSRHARSVASVAVGFMEGELIGPAHGAMVIGATTEFEPTETNQEEDNFVAALEWMESQMGVDVVNASIGYNIFDAGQEDYTKDDLDGNTGVTTVAADMAASLGVVMVNSAGNEGSNFWKLVIMPADGDLVIAVGAVDGTGARSLFSSFGPTADGRIKPDVVAMGSSVHLVTSAGTFGPSSGTSFSSPMVAAVVAQMLQVNPDLSPVEVREILRETASLGKLGPGNENNSLGWGIIDADEAITRAEELAIILSSETAVPEAFDLRPPYPNPTSGRITFDVRAFAQSARAKLSIYNILGQRVAIPFEGALSPGNNRIVFDTDRLTPGVYIYSFEGARVSQSGKLVILR